MRAAMRRVTIGLVAGLLGLVLAIVPSEFSPEQAHAAIAPGVPDPINVLPSVLTGSKAASLAPASFAEYLGVLTHKAAKSPAFWDAVKSVKAGTPSKTEADLVADAVKKFRLPAFKPQMMLKAAGGVGAALTSFDLGLSLGNGVLDVIGVSRDAGTLCTGTAGNDIATWWTSNFNHVDCAAFAELQLEEANSDMTYGLIGGESCNSNPAATRSCLMLAGVVTWVAGSTNYMSYCFTSTYGGEERDVSDYAIEVRDADGSWYLVASSLSPKKLSWSAGSNCRSRGVAAQTELGNTRISPYNNNAARMTGYRAYPGGVEQEPVERDVDPDRWLECRIKLRDGANLVAQSLTFKESSGSVPPVVCPEIPTGAEVEEFSIWEVGGGQSHELVPATQTTPEYDHARTTYPECMDGTCMLDLQKQDVSCFTAPDSCADWYADPDKESTYTCKYGSHTVSLAECGVYAPTFKPGAKPTGKEYADPATGQPLPNPAPAGSAPGSVADPNEPRQCWPTGWGMLNPVEWVYKPVQCVLEWAFVPRTQVVTQTMATAEAAWSETSPAKLQAAVAGWTFIAPPSGCNGITVEVFFLGPPFQIMNACPGSMLEDMAMWSRIFGNIAFSVYGVIAITRHIGRIIEFDGLGTNGGNS